MSQGPNDWTGSERRRPGQDLSEAVTELQRLTNSIAALATVHDQDKTDVRRQVIISSTAALVAVLLVVVFGDRRSDDLERDVRRGHDEITCLVLVPEASRDTTAKLNCREAVR